MRQPNTMDLFPDHGGQFQLLSEQELIRTLKVSRTTLWRMRTSGLPHITVGRSVRYDLEHVKHWLAENPSSSEGAYEPALINVRGNDGLLPCHWSPAVATDPKHRPQNPNEPSSTVRREWWRFPQEAHLLDEQNSRYRRLTAAEIAVLQGFAPGWGTGLGISDLELIRGYGDAVPVALSASLFRALDETLRLRSYRMVEICAGFGGLALGASNALPSDHRILIDRWDVACRVLRTSTSWSHDAVIEGDVREYDWDRFRDEIDIVSGGPPCQPWSNAGQRRGADDYRDLLGFMPELIRRVRPKAFLFENVPGLLAGDNEQYTQWLIRSLRSNGYAVLAGVLNAADFGVPQIRRRVFLCGLKDRPSGSVRAYFDLVYSRRTHSNPRKPISDVLKPWRTIKEALPDWSHNNHPWRMWLRLPQLFEESAASPKPMLVGIPTSNSESKFSIEAPTRIRLEWPHRGALPHWSNGEWQIESSSADHLSAKRVRPLIMTDKSRGNPFTDPWFIAGDSVLTLDALGRSVGRRADLVYIDAPRIKTNAATFEAAHSQSVLDTWLTVILALLKRSLRLVSDEGVLCVLCGINELPYIQELCTELAGPQNHVGTVAWQKGYSPRNLPNMRDLSPTHDNIVIFAKRKETLPSVALRIPPDGFANRDGDPRGPWNAEQKGANKPDCDYEINVCPYRWSLVDGALPPGIWRLNEKTGVIWGRGEDIKETGTWKFTVQVEDRSGERTTREFAIRVRTEGDGPQLCSLPWLLAARGENGKTKAPLASGPLRITTVELPNAVTSADYSACLLAKGGEPWRGTTRPGKTGKSGTTRYWEFPFKTLENRAAQDAVDFKKKDDAIPALKVYLGPASSTTLNQASLWLAKHKGDDDGFGVGFAQDAKKELQQLIDDGVISRLVGTSKPMSLVLRLVALFTRPSSVVIDVGSPAGELASISIACGRRTIYVEVPSRTDTARTVALPRLLYASQGRHPLPKNVRFTGVPGTTDNARGFFVDGRPRQPNVVAGVSWFEIGDTFAEVDRSLGVVSLRYESYTPPTAQFLSALASSEGLVPCTSGDTGYFAADLDGRLRAAYVGSSYFLDYILLEGLRSRHAEFLSSGGRLRVYYHRGMDSATVIEGHSLQLRRIPYDLRVMSEYS